MSGDELERLNATVDAREPRCELMELATRRVWMAQHPCSRAWFDAYQPEPGLIKLGYGAGVMDRAWFRRSPGEDADAPVERRELGGRSFLFVARPIDDERGGGPLRRQMVDKHHTIAFDAGRAVAVMTSEEGLHYVRVMGPPDDRQLPELPAGFQVRLLQLQGRVADRAARADRDLLAAGPAVVPGPDQRASLRPGRGGSPRHGSTS